MESRLLASEQLGKFGVFCSRLSIEIKYLQMHSVATKYGDGAMATRKVDC